MSSVLRITDDEMRYYQFKARQQFLIKKEDHEWNMLCKKNKCSCCSCQPLNTVELQKDVGSQTTVKPATNFKVQATKKPAFGQNVSVQRIQENPPSKSVNEMRAEIEKLKLLVSDIQLSHIKDSKEVIEKDTAVKSKIFGNESALNLLSEQRQNFIRACLLNSLQRLHSSAAQKMAKPVPSLPSPKKSKSFFLPPNLEKQRLISRNAYLSSLINKPKVAAKTNITSLDNKMKKSTKNNKTQPQNSLKTRKTKSAPTVKLNKDKTLIQAEAEVSTEKDENIENIVDCIVEDLLGEEILSLNRIKHMKLKKQNRDLKKGETIITTKATKKDIHLSQPSPETRAKLKQIPFFDFIERNYHNSSSLQIDSPHSHPVDSVNEIEFTNCARTSNSKDQSDKHVKAQKQITKTKTTDDKEAQTDNRYLVSSIPLRILHTDPKLAKRVKRQRKLYCQYLDRVSRSRSHNFDPIALSNMVAESLLNDCISDICGELDDIPTSLIADLYKQEFTTEL